VCVSVKWGAATTGTHGTLAFDLSWTGVRHDQAFKLSSTHSHNVLAEDHVHIFVHTILHAQRHVRRGGPGDGAVAHLKAGMVAERVSGCPCEWIVHRLPRPRIPTDRRVAERGVGPRPQHRPPVVLTGKARAVTAGNAAACTAGGGEAAAPSPYVLEGASKREHPPVHTDQPDLERFPFHGPLYGGTEPVVGSDVDSPPSEVNLSDRGGVH